MPKGYKLLQKPKITCVTCGNIKEVRDNWTVQKKKFCSRKCRRHSQDTKERIGRKKMGQKIHSELWKKELSETMKRNTRGFKVGGKSVFKGKKRPNISGKNHWNWKDGRCYDPKYISWISNKRGRNKKFAEGTHSFEEWDNLKKEKNYTCLHCRKKEPEIKLTEDHIIPLSKGGPDYISNIQPLCKSCNCKKHAKMPIEV